MSVLLVALSALITGLPSCPGLWDPIGYSWKLRFLARGRKPIKARPLEKVPLLERPALPRLSRAVRSRPLGTGPGSSPEWTSAAGSLPLAAAGARLLVTKPRDRSERQELGGPCPYQERCRLLRVSTDGQSCALARCEFLEAFSLTHRARQSRRRDFRTGRNHAFVRFRQTVRPGFPHCSGKVSRVG